jgi:hypothetical protein
MPDGKKRGRAMSRGLTEGGLKGAYFPTARRMIEVPLQAAWLGAG